MRSTSGINEPLIDLSKRIPARLFLSQSVAYVQHCRLLEKKLIDGLVLCNTSPLLLQQNSDSGCAYVPYRIRIKYTYAACPESPFSTLERGGDTSRLWFSAGVGLRTKQ